LIGVGNEKMGTSDVRRGVDVRLGTTRWALHAACNIARTLHSPVGLPIQFDIRWFFTENLRFIVGKDANEL
jgi:hypothetical protein